MFTFLQRSTGCNRKLSSGFNLLWNFVIHAGRIYEPAEKYWGPMSGLYIGFQTDIVSITGYILKVLFYMCALLDISVLNELQSKDKFH